MGWSSLILQRLTGGQVESQKRLILAEWPVDRPQSWWRIVNQPRTQQEEDALKRSIQRGRPFGGIQWEKPAATRLGLESTLRPRGRPRKDWI